MANEKAVMFLERLVKKSDDPDKKEWQIGGEPRSLNDLLQEVRSGSKIGNEYARSIGELKEKGKLGE
jgi:hypothetical protein